MTIPLFLVIPNGVRDPFEWLVAYNLKAGNQGVDVNKLEGILRLRLRMTIPLFLVIPNGVRDPFEF